MPRVAKDRRLKRKARLVRTLEQARRFWGQDWRGAQDRFLLTLSTDRHMDRGLRRMIRMARERAGLGGAPPLTLAALERMARGMPDAD